MSNTHCWAATFPKTHGLTHVEPRNDCRFFLTTSKDSSTKLFDVRCPSSSDRSKWKIHRDLNYDYRFNGAVLPTAPTKNSGSTDSSVVTYRGGHSVLKTLIRSRFSPPATTAQRYVYTGSSDGACAIYEATTGALLQRLEYHSSPSRDVSWHPYQPWLVIGSWDHTISSWHPSARDCGHSWRQKRPGSIISRDGRQTSGISRFDYVGLPLDTPPLLHILASSSDEDEVENAESGSDGKEDAPGRSQDS